VEKKKVGAKTSKVNEGLGRSFGKKGQGEKIIPLGNDLQKNE